jgi:hypothetical protein
MEQQRPQGKNIACGRRARHVPVESDFQNLVGRGYAISVAPWNNIQRPSTVVGRVEMNAKRGYPGQRLRVQLEARASMPHASSWRSSLGIPRSPRLASE